MVYAKILSIPEAIVEMTLKNISRRKRAIVDDPKYGIILSNVVAQNELSMKRIDVAINEQSFVSKLNNEMNDTDIVIEAIANITIREQTGNSAILRFMQINHAKNIIELSSTIHNFSVIVESNNNQEEENSVSNRGQSVTQNPSVNNETTGKPGKYEI